MKISVKIFIILFFLWVGVNYAQENQTKALHTKIFNSIEEGISNSNISLFSEFFGRQIYLNLKGGENGLFSANQAYYILQNYLSNRKIISFKFTSIGYADKIPFATGEIVFKYKSSHFFLQVYVSLTLIENKWVIDKINFY